jgi:phosphatidylserine/phosphatidylglycerophosphate/cardiolipin synthase-like enzyme
VFIIDDHFVITGSMNPTYKGAYINDENMLILNNPKVNDLYEAYIDYVYDYNKIRLFS